MKSIICWKKKHIVSMPNVESLATDRKTVWNMHAPDVNACPWHQLCFCQIELVKPSCWSFPPPEIASLPPFLSCPKTAFSKIPLCLWTTHLPVTCWYTSALFEGAPKQILGDLTLRIPTERVRSTARTCKLRWEQATEAVWLQICPALWIPVPRGFLL